MPPKTTPALIDDGLLGFIATPALRLLLPTSLAHGEPPIRDGRILRHVMDPLDLLLSKIPMDQRPLQERAEEAWRAYSHDLLDEASRLALESVGFQAIGDLTDGSFPSGSVRLMLRAGKYDPDKLSDQERDIIAFCGFVAAVPEGSDS